MKGPTTENSPFLQLENSHLLWLYIEPINCKYLFSNPFSFRTIFTIFLPFVIYLFFHFNFPRKFTDKTKTAPRKFVFVFLFRLLLCKVAVLRWFSSSLRGFGCKRYMGGIGNLFEIKKKAFKNLYFFIYFLLRFRCRNYGGKYEIMLIINILSK